MKKKTINILGLATVSALLSLAGCSKNHENDSPATGTGTNSKYVIAVASTATGTSSSYILTADAIASGSLSLSGNGYETSAGNFVLQNNTFFGLVYGFASQGPITPYTMSPVGTLNAVNTINAPSAQIYTTVNKDALLLATASRNINSPIATFTLLNAVHPQITGSSTVNQIKIAGNGELAFFYNLAQVDNKIYAPYQTIKGVTGNTFGSSYLDSTWVAVFSYPAMILEKIIRDNRTSYIGSYVGLNSLKQIDDGDVYAFSTAISGSTKPSAALLIKKGTETFDQGYFFNIEAASGGYKAARWVYAGGTLFLAEMYANKGASTGKVRLAVLDVDKQTVTWVGNAPSAYTPNQFYTPSYVESDKKTVDMPITDDNGNVALYVVDSSTATAKKGVALIGVSSVSAISKLTY